MWQDIVQLDRELLIFLNNLGSQPWDSFWREITKQFNWWPLFVIILALTFKAFGWKKALFVIIGIAILITFSDQFTNFIKDFFMRYRPNNNPLIKGQLRVIQGYSPRGNSFYSGHAATSTAFVSFMILLLKNKYKKIWLLIFFPLIFGYSRLYLGVHFPIDVLSGYVAGILIGFLFFKLYSYSESKIIKLS